MADNATPPKNGPQGNAAKDREAQRASHLRANLKRRKVPPKPPQGGQNPPK